MKAVDRCSLIEKSLPVIQKFACLTASQKEETLMGHRKNCLTHHFRLVKSPIREFFEE